MFACLICGGYIIGIPLIYGIGIYILGNTWPGIYLPLPPIPIIGGGIGIRGIIIIGCPLPCGSGIPKGGPITGGIPGI